MARPEIDPSAFEPNPAKQVFLAHGVWPYTFSAIKRDSIEGFYIDWLAEPEDLPISEIEAGHKVADRALNLTPYWVVSFVDEDAGRIYLNPTGPNPFITGVGAGGAKLTDWDYAVYSGEAERKVVDRVLDQISKGVVSSYRDIAYLLSGTVPFQFGPNGSQGGWYNVSDTWNNRGGRDGLTAKEIMIKDAASIQKFGLPVPPASLDGSMDVHIWNDLVSNNKIFRPREHSEIMFPGENWDDPGVMRYFILYHPLAQVKERNWDMLMEYWNPFPHEELAELWRQVDAGIYTEEHARGIERHLKEYWNRGETADEMLTPLVREVAVEISKMIPEPQWFEISFDPYWYLKEQVIRAAQKFDWLDVVELFEDSMDATNRRYVAYAYDHLKAPELLLRMEKKETVPETMLAILQALKDHNYKIVEIVSADLDKYRELTRERQSPQWDYHAKELKMWLRRQGLSF